MSVSGRPNRLPSFLSVSLSSSAAAAVSHHDSIAAALSLKSPNHKTATTQQPNNPPLHNTHPTSNPTQTQPTKENKKKQKNASSTLPNLPQSQRSPRLQTRRTTLSHFLFLRNQQISSRRRFEEYFYFRRSFSSSFSVEGVIGRETTSKRRCGCGGEGDGEVLCFLI